MFPRRGLAVIDDGYCCWWTGLIENDADRRIADPLRGLQVDFPPEERTVRLLVGEHWGTVTGSLVAVGKGGRS
jgi:hypothetical protein